MRAEGRRQDLIDAINNQSYQDVKNILAEGLDLNVDDDEVSILGIAFNKVYETLDNDDNTSLHILAELLRNGIKPQNEDEAKILRTICTEIIAHYNKDTNLGEVTFKTFLEVAYDMPEVMLAKHSIARKMYNLREKQQEAIKQSIEGHDDGRSGLDVAAMKKMFRDAALVIPGIDTYLMFYEEYVMDKMMRPQVEDQRVMENEIQEEVEQALPFEHALDPLNELTIQVIWMSALDCAASEFLEALNDVTFVKVADESYIFLIDALLIKNALYRQEPVNELPLNTNFLYCRFLKPQAVPEETLQQLMFLKAKLTRESSSFSLRYLSRRVERFSNCRKELNQEVLNSEDNDNNDVLTLEDVLTLSDGEKDAGINEFRMNDRNSSALAFVHTVNHAQQHEQEEREEEEEEEEEEEIEEEQQQTQENVHRESYHVLGGFNRVLSINQTLNLIRDELKELNEKIKKGDQGYTHSSEYEWVYKEDAALRLYFGLRNNIINRVSQKDEFKHNAVAIDGNHIKNKFSLVNILSPKDPQKPLNSVNISYRANIIAEDEHFASGFKKDVKQYLSPNWNFCQYSPYLSPSLQFLNIIKNISEREQEEGSKLLLLQSYKDIVKITGQGKDIEVYYDEGGVENSDELWDEFYSFIRAFYPYEAKHLERLREMKPDFIPTEAYIFSMFSVLSSNKESVFIPVMASLNKEQVNYIFQNLLEREADKVSIKKLITNLNGVCTVLASIPYEISEVEMDFALFVAEKDPDLMHNNIDDFFELFDLKNNLMTRDDVKKFCKAFVTCKMTGITVVEGLRTASNILRKAVNNGCLKEQLDCLEGLDLGLLRDDGPMNTSQPRLIISEAINVPKVGEVRRGIVNNTNSYIFFLDYEAAKEASYDQTVRVAHINAADAYTLLSVLKPKKERENIAFYREKQRFISEKSKDFYKDSQDEEEIYLNQARENIIIANYIEMTVGDKYVKGEGYEFELKQLCKVQSYGMHSESNNNAYVNTKRLNMDYRTFALLQVLTHDIYHTFCLYGNDLYLLSQLRSPSKDVDLFLAQNAFEASSVLIALNILSFTDGDEEEKKALADHKYKILEGFVHGEEKAGASILNALYKKSSAPEEAVNINQINAILSEIGTSQVFRHLVYKFSTADWSEKSIQPVSSKVMLYALKELQKKAQDINYQEVSEWVDKHFPFKKLKEKNRRNPRANTLLDILAFNKFGFDLSENERKFLNNLQNKQADPRDLRLFNIELKKANITSFVREHGDNLDPAILGIFNDNFSKVVQNSANAGFGFLVNKFKDLTKDKEKIESDERYVSNFEEIKGFVCKNLIYEFISWNLGSDEELMQCYGEYIYNMVVASIPEGVVNSAILSENIDQVQEIVKSMSLAVKSLNERFGAAEVVPIFKNINKMVATCSSKKMRNIHAELDIVKSILGIGNKDFYDQDPLEIMVQISEFCAKHANEFAFASELMQENLKHCIEFIYNNQNIELDIESLLNLSLKTTKEYIDITGYSTFYTSQYYRWKEDVEAQDIASQAKKTVLNLEQSSGVVLEALQNSAMGKFCAGENFSNHELLASIVQPTSSQEIELKEIYKDLLGKCNNDSEIFALKILAQAGAFSVGIVLIAQFGAVVAAGPAAAITIPLLIASKSRDILKSIFKIADLTGMTGKMMTAAEKVGFTSLYDKIKDPLEKVGGYIDSAKNIGEEKWNEASVIAKGFAKTGRVNPAEAKRIEQEEQARKLQQQQDEKKLQLRFHEFVKYANNTLQERVSAPLAISAKLGHNEVVPLYDKHSFLDGQYIINILSSSLNIKETFSLVKLIDKLGIKELYESLALCEEEEKGKLAHALAVISKIIALKKEAVNAEEVKVIIDLVLKRGKAELKELNGMNALLSFESILQALEEAAPGKIMQQLENLSFYNEKMQELKNAAQNIDMSLLVNKIQNIKEKFHDGEKALSADQRIALQKDANTVIRIFLNDTILYTDKAGKGYNIYSIPQHYVKKMLADCRKISADPNATDKRKHEAKLLSLAIFMRSMFFAMPSPVFLNEAQLAAIFNHLEHLYDAPMHQIDTGEGKSIITAINACINWLVGTTPFVSTANNDLARKGLEEFKPFFELCGIPFAEKIITASSSIDDIVQDGIHYTTFHEMALCKTSIEQNGGKLPSNASCTIDEVDSMLTTLVSYIYSVLEYKDKKSHKRLIQDTLSFVKNPKYFRDNDVSRVTATENLRKYIEFQINADEQNAKNAQYKEFLQEIPNDALEVILNAAVQSESYEQLVDFMTARVYEKKNLNGEVFNKPYKTAAPILSSTHTPTPEVVIKEVQQFIHAQLNQDMENAESRGYSKQVKYKVDPPSLNIIVSHYKNLIDFFYKGSGVVSGVTGTTGSGVELEGFEKHHNFRTFTYPRQKENLLQINPMILYETEKEMYEKMHEAFSDASVDDEKRALYIIADSPKEVLKVKDAITGKVEGYNIIQQYTGEQGENAEAIMKQAGKNRTITVTSQIGGRGCNPRPEHESGIAVFILGTPKTDRDWKQGIGRGARFGAKGEFTQINNKERLNKELIEFGLSSFQDRCRAAAPGKSEVEIAQEAMREIMLKNEEKGKLRRDMDIPLAEVRSYLARRFTKIRNRLNAFARKKSGIYKTGIDESQYRKLQNQLNEGLTQWWNEEIKSSKYYDIDGNFKEEEARSELYRYARIKWDELMDHVLKTEVCTTAPKSLFLDFEKLSDLHQNFPDSLAQAKISDIRKITTTVGTIRDVVGENSVASIIEAFEKNSNINAIQELDDNNPDIIDITNNFYDFKNIVTIFVVIASNERWIDESGINSRIRSYVTTVNENLSATNKTVSEVPARIQGYFKKTFDKIRPEKDNVFITPLLAPLKSIEDMEWKALPDTLSCLIEAALGLCAQLTSIFSHNTIGMAIAKTMDVKQGYVDNITERERYEEYGKQEKFNINIELQIDKYRNSKAFLEEISNIIQIFFECINLITTAISTAGTIATGGAATASSFLLAPIKNQIMKVALSAALQGIKKGVEASVGKENAKPICAILDVLIDFKPLIDNLSDVMGSLQSITTDGEEADLTKLIHALTQVFDEKQILKFSKVFQKALEVEGDNSKKFKDNLKLIAKSINYFLYSLDELEDKRISAILPQMGSVISNSVINIVNDPEVLSILERRYKQTHLHEILPKFAAILEIDKEILRGLKLTDAISLYTVLTHPKMQALVDSAAGDWTIDDIIQVMQGHKPLPEDASQELKLAFEELAAIIASPEQYKILDQRELRNIKDKADIDIKSHCDKLHDRLYRRQVQDYEISQIDEVYDLSPINERPEIEERESDVIIAASYQDKYANLLQDLKDLSKKTSTMDFVKRKYIYNLILGIQKAGKPVEEYKFISLLNELICITSEDSSLDGDKQFNKFFNIESGLIYSDVQNLIYNALDYMRDNTSHSIDITNSHRALIDTAIYECGLLNPAPQRLLELLRVAKNRKEAKDAMQACISVSNFLNKRGENQDEHYQRIQKIIAQIVHEQSFPYLRSDKYVELELIGKVIVDFDNQTLSAYALQRSSQNISKGMTALHTKLDQYVFARSGIITRGTVFSKAFIIASFSCIVSYCYAPVTIPCTIVASILVCGSSKKTEGEKYYEAKDNFRKGLLVSCLSMFQMYPWLNETFDGWKNSLYEIIMDNTPDFGICLSEAYDTVSATVSEWMRVIDAELGISQGVNSMLATMPPDLSHFFSSTLLTSHFALTCLQFGLTLFIAYHQYCPLIEHNKSDKSSRDFDGNNSL